MRPKVRIFNPNTSGLLLWLIYGIIAWKDAPAFAQCGALPGDSNNNQHVELVDHSDFVKCFAAPGQTPLPEPPQSTDSCLADFDADADFDTDLFDFAEFQATFTGPIRRECFNIVFVSSSGFQPTLGGVQAYDNQCNVLATAAGLNNATGNAFVAWVSSSASLARNRIGSAQGFIRPDGVPIANSINDLLTNNALWNPIRLDEHGNDVGAAVVITGTQFNGTASTLNCSNWTSTSGFFLAGGTAEGPGAWTHYSQAFCNSGPFRIYCFQKNRIHSLDPPRSLGKVIYLTNTLFTPGAGLAAADQLCATGKPPGAGNVRAILATSTTSAASRFIPTARYVRVDGQLVGTGIELAGANLLHSGIWQTGSGTYVLTQPAWTGSSNFAAVGTQAGTCNNWTSTNSPSGIAGLPVTTQVPGWWNSYLQGCTTALRIYCAEQ